MSWVVNVDRAACIGSGLCSAAAPGHFELAGGAARPVRERIDPADEVIEAAESCPVEAIIVTESASGKVLAPGE
jgi:ferredoxin